LAGRATGEAANRSAARDRGGQDKKTGDALHRPLIIALPRNVLVMARSMRPIGTLVFFFEGAAGAATPIAGKEDDREIGRM
jgi:hypothetical protein